MQTVHEISKQTGVSIRALHYYDSIGLLRPSRVSESGYRLYDDSALARLQTILLFKALGFPLKEIRRILESPNFRPDQALEQQIALLKLQKERITKLISFARGIQLTGVNNMDFSAFDTSKIDSYAAQAKALWGKTDAYREFEEKAQGRKEDEQKRIDEGLMEIFVRFGALKHLPPQSAEARETVEALQQYITQNYYHCTPQILSSLGAMYAADGEMKDNIDKAGGPGTAVFAAKAIECALQ